MSAKPKKRRVKLGLPKYVVIKEGSWNVRLGFRTNLKDEKGRPIYEQVSRKCEPETAERAAEIVAFLKNQRTEQKSQMHAVQTLNQFIEQFLAFKKSNVTRRTIEFYEYIYQHHIKSSDLGRTPITEIKAMHIQMFYSTLDVSPQRIRKVHLLLSMAFKQALLWDLVIKDPTKGVILPKVRPTESSAMSAAEMKAFITACRTDDQFIIFELAIESGLRPQECVALRWKDINFAQRRIRVAQAMTTGYSSGGFEIKEPKTENSRRTVGFSPQLKQRLLRQREIVEAVKEGLRSAAELPLKTQKRVKGVNYAKRLRHRQIAKTTLDNFKKYDLVFPASSGGPLALNNINRREFKSVLKLASIESNKYSFKSLRHTCLTFLADHLHPKKLQKLAGHSRLETTLRFYIHVHDESIFEASDKMTEMFY